MPGFADVLRSRGEQSVPPAAGDPAGSGGTAPAPTTEPLSDGPVDAFLAGLSPAARATTERRLAEAQGHTPLDASQHEIDAMTDDEKWSWLEGVCHQEEQTQRTAAAKEAQAAALAAQTTIEGHHHD